MSTHPAPEPVEELPALTSAAWSLFLCAFCLPLSLAAAQFFAYLAVPLALWEARTRRDGRDWRSLLFLLALAYAALAVASVWTGIRPEKTIDRLHRLFLFGLIPATAALLRWHASLWARLTAAFVVACLLRSLYDLVRFPIHVWVRDLAVPDFGNMRDPQFYMAGFLLALGLMRAGRALPANLQGAGPGFMMVAAGCLMGILLHQKRGVWLACALAFVLLVVLWRKWRWLLALVAAVAILFVVPFTRARLEALGEIWNPKKGDRALLWQKIAPKLIAAHPWGMGYEAITNADLKKAHSGVQVKLDHLHNNPLQVTAELGWPGLAVWSAWMIAALARLACRVRRESDPGARTLLAATLAALVGLHLNGMVENSFGDTETLMFFCLLLGVAGVRRAAPEPDRAG